MIEQSLHVTRSLSLCIYTGWIGGASMPAQVRYDQAILAGEFVKAESPISAGTGVAMQQEQWLTLTCINVVHLHVRKGHGLSWRERCSHGVVLCFEVFLRAVLCCFAVIIIYPFVKSYHLAVGLIL